MPVWGLIEKIFDISKDKNKSMTRIKSTMRFIRNLYKKKQPSLGRIITQKYFKN